MPSHRTQLCLRVNMRELLVLVACLLAIVAPATAQQDAPSIRSLNNALGFREHIPGFWSFLNPEITNPSDQDQELEVVAFFAVAQNQKFARRIVVPARSTLKTSLPILIPPLDKIPENPATGNPQRSLNVQVHLYDVAGSEPRLLLANGKRSFDTQIALRNLEFGKPDPKYRATAMFQSAVAEREAAQEMSEEMITATRLHFNQVGRVGKSMTKFLPESMRAYESIDQIVLHNDHLKNDVGGLEAVRRWLARGGSLWIMLDLVSEETVRKILGDDTPFQEVDRTTLTTTLIEDADIEPGKSGAKPQTFEKPVDFVRVVVNRGDVLHKIDGWPASFSISSGEGKVYFTTIGSRAWVRELDSRADRVPDSRLGITKYTPNDPLEQIGYELFAGEKPEPRFDAVALKENLINQVGYRVLPLGTTITILASYAGVLLLLGLWFAKNACLERLFYVGPILAIFAGLMFYLVGFSNRQAAHSALASFQLVQQIPGTNELQVDGMTVLYSQGGQEFDLGATRDGFIKAGQTDSTLETKTIWNHQGTWQYANSRIEPGIMSYEVASNVAQKELMNATAQFSESGLSGSIKGSSELDLEDLVLALPNGEKLSVPLQNGQFKIDGADVLSADEYIRSNLLSDKQRWHQSIYRAMFSASSKSSNSNKSETNRKTVLDWRPPRPTLFAWSKPLELDVQFPEEYERAGGALNKLPISIGKTPSNSKVKIPAAFVDVSNVINSKNAISPVFDAKSRKWFGSINKESTTRLRFQIPPQALPIEIESVTLQIESIQGLNRKISIKHVNGKETKEIKEFDDFSGRFEQRLTDSSLLHLDDQGGYLVDIDVTVKPEFFERQKEVEASGELNSDGTPKKLVLSPEELKGISLQVTGTTR